MRDESAPLSQQAAEISATGVRFRKQHPDRMATNVTRSALPAIVAKQVERYAVEVDGSMSKAINALVRLGLESQEIRKRDFFKRLRENLAHDDPQREDRLVDEFRMLILGR